MNYKVFIIGIDLSTVKGKKSFESALSFIGGWKRVSDGFYIIKPNAPVDTSEDLKNKIPNHHYNNGQIFIMRTSIDAAWEATPELNSWLSFNL